MSAAIIQQDSWSNNGDASPWTQNFIFADGNPGQKNVTGGNAILVFWAGPTGNPLSSITDNYGNSYSKIAGASKNDAGLGYDGEWWIASNVAAVTYPAVGPRLALTFTYAGSASANVGFWALEISGINSATQLTGTESINITNGSNFSGLSLDGGSVGAIYLTGFSGFAEHKVTVAAPWSLSSVLQEILAPTVATLASTGVQQPTCTPDTTGHWYIGVVCGIAFTGVSIAIPPSLPVIPSYRDQGHIYDGILYTGTLTGWAGREGVITPNVSLGDTPLPIAHFGEVPSARAHIDDFLFTPVNGQRVQFYMLRNSIGDKLAISIAAL